MSGSIAERALPDSTCGVPAGGFVGGERVLETPRLVLRRFTLADAPQLAALDADPEVMRFISKGQPTPLGRIQREILPRWLEYYREEPPRGFWAAHLLETGEFAGWFHLRPDRLSPGEVELGYRLVRRHWGRGLATEGGRALVRKAFGEWGVNLLSSRTLVANVASQRVLEKCGLRFECNFVYEAEVLPGWSEEERRAVKYTASATERGTHTKVGDGQTGEGEGSKISGA